MWLNHPQKDSISKKIGCSQGTDYPRSFYRPPVGSNPFWGFFCLIFPGLRAGSQVVEQPGPYQPQQNLGTETGLILKDALTARTRDRPRTQVWIY